MSFYDRGAGEAMATLVAQIRAAELKRRAAARGFLTQSEARELESLKPYLPKPTKEAGHDRRRS
jgi:phage portal protein BeeE